MEFKQILKDFLEDNYLTQKRGVKGARVSEWLKGKAKPGYDNLRAMAKAYNVPADYFLGLTDKY